MKFFYLNPNIALDTTYLFNKRIKNFPVYTIIIKINNNTIKSLLLNLSLDNLIKKTYSDIHLKHFQKL